MFKVRMSVLNLPGRPVSLAEILRVLRGTFAEGIGNSFEAIPRWRDLALAEKGHRAEYVDLHFGAFVDYIQEYFSSGDVAFRQLFIGECLKALYDPEADEANFVGQAREVSRAMTSASIEVAQRSLQPEDLRRLEDFFSYVESTLTAPARKVQRVLLIGDCLHLDIVPFIVADLLADGIRFLPDYATSKHPELLREQLRKLGSRKFDLVFFSPFTYEFSPDYARLADWRQMLVGQSEAQAIVEASWAETEKTVRLASDLFDCPIFIHNSAAIIREESGAKRLLKQKATARVRLAAKTRMNDLVAATIEDINRESFRHLFLFDEDLYARESGEHEAGAYLYRTQLQHPAALGRILARQYREILFVNAWLVTKKLVVCDLDNTLWDGVIGEGEVRHFHDRQAVLQSLKGKGVVLAINSKNDPAKVHFRGGTLSADDFVYSAISWDPKVQGMKRIQSGLNLKFKDFVFVDDREDERELVRLTYPDVVCADATDATTWRRFALWAALIDPDPTMDRTLMYRQREERKAFVQEDDIVPEAEREAMFGSLGLKLTIARAGANDLKRVAELINRTNQFNLDGSRTTLREVREWHESPGHVILLGHTADRFGEMGVTCIAVARIAGSEMVLLPFVLSCRVFGYGIEHAMIEYLKRTAGAQGASRAVGRYLPTPQNSPCKDFLAESGFAPQGEIWVAELPGVGKPPPSWLEVSAPLIPVGESR